MSIQLGKIIATAAVNTQIEINPYFNNLVKMCLRKHQSADFSGCYTEDAERNRAALENGDRILNVFPIPNAIMKSEDKLWIITEADRTITTVLFPSDY